MANKHQAIPPVTTKDADLAQALTALKNNVELINGSRPGTSQLRQLSTTATQAQIITAVNQIIARLNFAGE
jgi:hypothetical protein